jgi:O-antigen/teichoic acid export membrane protein
MIVYTLLDPIVGTISHVFTAIGKPEKVAVIRGVQSVFLVVGLFIFGTRLDIAGVALSVNIMSAVGIILLLYQVRAYVDFSIKKMFYAPTIALLTGMGLGRLSILIPGVLGSPWRTGSLKFIVFVVTYVSIIIILERDQIPMLYRVFIKYLPLNKAKKDKITW